MSEEGNGVESVAELIEKAATLSRDSEFIDAVSPYLEPVHTNSLPFVLSGVVVGIGIGGALGFYITRRKLETKYQKITQDEIAEMREHYLAKGVALENKVEKPKLEDIVREQGYSAEPPMAVTPPTAVVEAAQEDEEVKPEPKQENVFGKDPIPEEEVGYPLIDRNWDYHKERVGRSPIKPYVIHRDEKDENESYDTVTYTYYEEDDVLCNERDEVIGKEDRNLLIGESNLGKFGHGSGDPSIVYIRNDKLEMQMEIVRSPNSFAEEVHGFQHSEYLARRHRRDRSSPDDE